MLGASDLLKDLNRRAMTTHTPPMTNAIGPPAFPSRTWVMNSTPSYTAPTRPPSLTQPSSAVPALFAKGSRLHSALARCLRAPLGLPLHPSDPSTPTKSFFFPTRTDTTYVTPVGIWTASSPTSLPSQLGYGNVPYPSCPLIPGSTAAPPLPLSHP